MSPESTSPSGQALPAGTRLEEFEVERVLGRGGFGITYLALDSSLGRQVVIKENLPAMFAYRETTSGTVRPQSESGEDADNFRWSMENFLREADTLASLDHPGIVSVLRKFEANGTAYFVMPHVEGLALDAMQKRRREKGQSFGDDELKGLLEHVLDALGYLHARGIYHRDIKPGNILVTNEGVPILIDFGSARQRLSERSMTVIESAGYTPFEQLESRGNVGPWSDLYALGATVAKAITGEAPPKAMDRMRNDPFVRLARRPGLQDRYSRVLLGSLDRALAVDEEARWQEAGQWQQALMEEPVPPVTVAPPPVKVVPEAAVAAVPPAPEAPARTMVAAAPIGAGSAGVETQGAGKEKFSRGVLLSAGFALVLVVGFVALMMTLEHPRKGHVAPEEAEAAPKRAESEFLEERRKPEVAPKRAEAELATRNNPEEDVPAANKPVTPAPEPLTESKPADPAPDPLTIPQTADPPEPEESITQALTRLQVKLQAGDLSALPDGAAKRGNSHFLLVDTPLNWPSASRFAEDHGAQMAALENKEDLAWAISEFKLSVPTWVGLSDSGTEGSWYWVNGRPPEESLWAAGQPDNTNSRDDGENYAALLPDHSLDDLAGSRPLPFLLQWGEDGNEGSIASQLKRVGASLKAKRPIFPAGTRNIGGSRFLVVPESVSWADAQNISLAAGGHLAVPSTTEEAAWITKTMESVLGGGDGCWLGGLQQGVAPPRWTFVTGERFDFVSWAPGQPDEGDTPQPSLQMWRGVDSAFGYNNAPGEAGQASCFLVEWSAHSRRNMEGEASFFGLSREGKRVAYVVDFSGSMGSTAEGGGTFAQALKKELTKSISNLNSGMYFTVIFFSSRAWNLTTEGNDYVGNGWHGLGEPPHTNWYPANEGVKKEVVAKINRMPVNGGTMWYPGLKMAMTMNPPPSIVYLVSDGEPRDGDAISFNMKQLNPGGTPIDTIAFEVPGSPAGRLMEIAKNTGGKFVTVYKGERKTGQAAEALTNPKYD